MSMSFTAGVSGRRGEGVGKGGDSTRLAMSAVKSAPTKSGWWGGIVTWGGWWDEVGW